MDSQRTCQEVRAIISTAPVHYRKSRIRNNILDYLKNSTAHPSAEDVHLFVREQNPRISFGTVYRNLNILVDTGEVQRLESSRGRDRFDARFPQHAHFRCESCENLCDLPLVPDKLIVELSEKTGHEITAHNLEFSGTCSTCSSNSRL
ncbi:MAG: transcriptional repressor [Spirochaetes bacterium]|nr:MAG: transcriptional repressor [Spirochaetota bacterium]